MAKVNFDEIKVSAVKSTVREVLLRACVEGLKAEFGEDAVSQVGKSEIAICVGLRTLKDGTQGEVCATLSPVAKDFDFRTATSGKVFVPYERLTEADAYEISVKEAEEKEKKKQAEKKAKMERDKKEREKKKAEKENQ